MLSDRRFIILPYDSKLDGVMNEKKTRKVNFDDIHSFLEYVSALEEYVLETRNYLESDENIQKLAEKLEKKKITVINELDFTEKEDVNKFGKR